MYNYSNVVFTNDIEDTLDDYSRYKFGKGLFTKPTIPVAITVSPLGFAYFPSNEMIEDGNPKLVSLSNTGKSRLYLNRRTIANTYRHLRENFQGYGIGNLCLMHAYIALNTGRLLENNPYISVVPYTNPHDLVAYMQNNNTIEYRAGFTENKEHFLAMLTLGFPYPCPDLVVIESENDLDDYYVMEAYLELLETIGR